MGLDVHSIKAGSENVLATSCIREERPAERWHEAVLNPKNERRTQHSQKYRRPRAAR